MSDNHRNNMGWFLAGLSLGAVAAVLYAPKAGHETRKAMVTGVDNGGKHIASLGRSAREQVSDWLASGKELVTGKKRQADKATDGGREALRDIVAEKGT